MARHYGTAVIPARVKKPKANMQDMTGNPTIADAILERLIHNAYRIDLKGESMRKKKTNLTQNK